MNAPTACSRCGALLSPGERFCTACGQPVAAAGKSGLGLVIAVGGVLMAFLLGVVLVVAWTRLRPSNPPTAGAAATASTAKARETRPDVAKPASESSVVDDNVVFVLPGNKSAKGGDTAKQPASPPSAEYVLPHSADRRLRREEVVALTPEQRRLARNEIFARHGYQFQSADLREYFGKKGWYKPNPGFSESSLSATEKANAEMVRQIEVESR